MANWTSGYVDSIEYTHGYYRELSPSYLNFSLLLARTRAIGLQGTVTFCELGCGQGLSANILAAANPEIQFYATDFNPQHIAGAKRLASTGGLNNVHFYDQAFADFAHEPSLPAAFDCIALHGIYSWISAENRRHIVDFILRRLKPGGTVYISYNTLPGWAPAMPLRRLMVDQAALASGPMAARIDQALAYVEQLFATNPSYLRGNPTLTQRLDKIKSASRRYLAHEYFNRDWTPFYFADVAAELAEAKLNFVGSANPADFVDILNFSPEQMLLVRESADPVRREQIRDYIVNQQFRRDIFCKGGLGLSGVAQRDAWLNMRFALSIERDTVPKIYNGPLGEAKLHADSYDPVLDFLARGPATVLELVTDPTVNALGTDRLIQVLSVATALGSVQPCLSVQDEPKRIKTARVLNAAIMKMAEESEEIAYLASPVIGGGVGASRFDQLFLSAHLAKRQDSVAWVWEILHRENRRLIKEGQPLQEPDENLAELRKMEEAFRARKLPLFRQLGIA